MFETVRAKTWMIKHIRDLFRARADDLCPATWTCVVRNGNVTVMRHFMTQTQDHEVIRRLLPPGHLPSWLQTNWAVRKHWSVLKPIAMESRFRSRAGEKQTLARGLRCGIRRSGATTEREDRSMNNKRTAAARFAKRA